MDWIHLAQDSELVVGCIQYQTFGNFYSIELIRTKCSQVVRTLA
jgi:hypothetical protein